MHGLHLLRHRGRRRHPRHHPVHGRVVARHHLGDVRRRICQSQGDRAERTHHPPGAVPVAHERLRHGSRIGTAQIEEIRTRISAIVGDFHRIAGHVGPIADAQVLELDEDHAAVIEGGLACRRQGKRSYRPLLDDLLALGDRRGARARGIDGAARARGAAVLLRLVEPDALVELLRQLSLLPLPLVCPRGLAVEASDARAGAHEQRGQEGENEDADGFPRKAHVYPLPRRNTATMRTGTNTDEDILSGTRIPKAKDGTLENKGGLP